MRSLVNLKAFYHFIFLAVFFSASAQSTNRDTNWARINKLPLAPDLSHPQKIILLQNYLDSLRIKNCLGDSVHAMLLRKIGFEYSFISDYQRAASYFLQSIQVISLNSNKSAVNPKHLINTYYWLSTFYDSLQNLVAKKNALDSCILVSSRLNGHLEISRIRCLESRAEFYFDVGDFQRCVSDADVCEKAAWEYAKRKPEDQKLGKQLALTSLGWHIEALLRSGDYAVAEAFLNTKLSEYKHMGSERYLGFLFGQLGQLEVQRGNLKKALVNFEKALSLEKSAGSNYSCKQISNTIAFEIFFTRLRDDKLALRYYNRALGFINKDNLKNRDDQLETVQIYDRMGAVFTSRRDFDSAFACFQLAFDQIKPGIGEHDILKMSVDEITNNSKSHMLAALIIDKADTYLARFKQQGNRQDIRQAIRIYKMADKLLQVLNTRHTEVKSKLYWRARTRQLYEHAIQACEIMGDMADAFYFFEKSRAVLLNEQLAQQNLFNEKDIELQVQVKKKIAGLNRELDNSKINSEQYGHLRNELFEAQSDMDGIIERIKLGNPLYYQTVLDTSFTSLNDIQQHLQKNGQALLEIFSGDSAIYTLFFSSGKTVLYKLEKKEFEENAKRYLKILKNSGDINREFQQFINLAHRLYRQLFNNQRIPEARLIVSPDQYNFPFESLVVDDKGHSPNYLVYDHAVSYTYSAGFLLNEFRTDAATNVGDFLGVAPVTFRQGLGSLPGSDLSVQKISSRFTLSNKLLGSQASRSSFIKYFPGYSIIQVYTHATGNNEDQEPVIHFSDSSMFLSDLIPDAKPVTRLIVLSACETAGGEYFQGEGIFNFNRGFAALGIPSSVTNLWSVDNRATYELTELFYHYLSIGFPLDIALQKAKKRFMQSGEKQKLLPYYWAAAVLVGKTAPIEPAPDPYLYSLFGLIAALSLVVPAVVLIKRKKRLHLIGNNSK